jgi:uncharacterized protein (TIGR02996 family)
MSESHFIKQTEPTWCERGAVLFVRRGSEAAVRDRLGGGSIHYQELPIRIPTPGCNIDDGLYEETRGLVIIQSGSKHYDGWDVAFGILEHVSPYLENARFYREWSQRVSMVDIIDGRILETPLPGVKSIEKHLWESTRDSQWFERAVSDRAAGSCEVCDDWKETKVCIAPGTHLDLSECIRICDRCAALEDPSVDPEQVYLAISDDLVGDRSRPAFARRLARRALEHALTITPDGAWFQDAIIRLLSELVLTGLPERLAITTDAIERELLLKLIHHPDDAETRSVYADWLEAHGRTAEASVLRG